MNKLKIILFVIFFTPATLPAIAQKDSSITYIKMIPGDYKYFTVDNLGDVYLVTANDQLKKFKDLLDNGAITEDEYNLQKDKLLNQNHN